MVKPRTRHKQFPFDLDSAALLVIDMQRFFTDEESHAFIPSSDKLINNISKLANSFYKNNRPVICTRHIDTDPSNMMSRWWQDRLKETDIESELDERLISGNATIIIKHNYDAFFKTELEEILKKQGVTQVLITGVVTHLCCETTARSAFMRDFETYIITDSTADYTDEYHQASLLNLSHGFAIPASTEEILKEIG